MLPNPLHPAIVHLPLALAVLIPLLLLFAVWKVRKGSSLKDVWMPAVVMAFLLFVSALVATNTGESDEEVVEEVVSEQVIEAHEERAEAFTYAAGFLFLISAAGFLKAKAGQAARWLTVAASVVVFVLALRVGHSGGSLVYEHGAGSVVRPASTTSVWAGRPGCRTLGGRHRMAHTN
jgi:uncharacterized membrane protein